MAFQTDSDGNIYDDGQPSPAQITVSKLPVNYNDDGGGGNTPQWVNLDNSQFDQSAFDTAAQRLKRGASHRLKLPVNDDRYNLLPSENPTYMVQPDLQDTQSGNVPLPPGAVLNDANQPVWAATGEPVPMVPRPGLIPLVRTPEGVKLAMPKLLDLASNIVGGGAATKVPVKAGEMVLGSGVARTAEEVAKKASTIAEPFYSQLERSVKDARLEKGNAEQWLGYLKNQPGVKAEEINMVLKELPAGQITKPQMEDIVKQNKVELKEKVLQDNEHFQLHYKDTLPRRLTVFGPVLDEIKDVSDIALAKRHNSSFRETVKNVGDLKAFEAVQEAKKLPNFDKQLGQFDTRQEAEQAVKNLKGEDHIEIAKKQNDKETKYSSYQLPGGDNYKEMLLKKFRAYKNEESFHAPHFDAPDNVNLLAHIRMNDRIVDSKKILHLEEIQSDLHQAGRDKGYKGEKEKLQPAFDKIEEKLMATNDEKMLGQPRIADVLNEAVSKKIITPEEAKTYKRYTDIENSPNPVPDFPFKNNWEELAIKRIIRHAAENGYEGISWEHGNAQALRYQNEIRQKLRSVEWSDNPQYNKDGTKDVHVIPEGGSRIQLKIDKNGTIIDGHKDLKNKTLSEAIGKDLAKQVMEKAYGTIDAKGYVMGAEGMKSAYDVRIPNKFNEIGKKYGSKVEQKFIQGELTQPEKNAMNYYNSLSEAERNKIASDVRAGYEKLGKKPIHYFPITPALKAKALQEGFPLFSSSPVLVPISGDPFASNNQKRYKLTPVANNPFLVP